MGTLCVLSDFAMNVKLFQKLSFKVVNKERKKENGTCQPTTLFFHSPDQYLFTYYHMTFYWCISFYFTYIR